MSDHGTLGLILVAAPFVASGVAFLYRWSKRPEPVLSAQEVGGHHGGNIIPFIKATREERESVMRLQEHRCGNPYCNMDLRLGSPHWDHITPRSKGGNDSVHNMQWLCETCNLNKGSMNWLEFIYRYSTGMGIDPNVNQKPWQQWIQKREQLNRSSA